MSETRINETELEELKHKLLSLRTKLHDLEGPSKQAATPVEPGLSPRAAMQAQLLAEEPARQRQRHLGKIEGALRRIEAGDYGNCFVCGNEIDGRRLLTDPTVTRCIKCVEG